MSHELDAIVLGGGPAGSAVGRLLSAWGHSVLILDTPATPSRGLAESLPPSTQKLLAQIGVLDVVERAGFFRATGNTVWWASGDRRVEPFGSARQAMGYQVHRPAFDRVLRDSARAAGADVRMNARVRDVRFENERSVIVEYDDSDDGRRHSSVCRFVLDCSGRAGLIGRRFRRAEPGYRTCALVGVWRKSKGWDLPDETHTIVETYDDGWMWSVPISKTTRHVGAMVDRASPTAAGGRALETAYRGETAKATNLGGLLEGATLQRVWACDASLYSAAQYAGPQFLLIGDAGSFIDPLSSFGVKKALASAWLGAIVVHTCLTDPIRQDVALEFFSNWERDVYARHLRRSRDFARDAHARHPHAFWASRAAKDVEAREAGESDLARDPDVLAAFERFKQAPSIHLTLADNVRVESRPVIRDREIVLENAFIDQAGLKTRPTSAGSATSAGLATSAESATSAGSALRFLGNVDLVKLADIACRHSDVPDVFEDYCRTCAPVPLPSVVGGLSVLVAKGILHERA
ncbi:MAG: tryptophan 7-halogenase [Acidobacteria bacterium]|nr:tryptophan 7-halogenase [Acidobacteriota bacterium]